MKNLEYPPFLVSEKAFDPAVAVLPVPYERTTSWGRGAEAGPSALLKASRYVELYDQELDLEPCRIGIETLPPVDVETSEESALDQISEEAAESTRRGRFLCAIGGEHTVTPALVRGVASAHGKPLGIVQFDAHADLRQTYSGSRWNHACAMSRVLDLDVPLLATGIRSLSRSEAARIERRNLPVIPADQLHALDEADLESLFIGLLASLPDTIYLTFDLDFFDPSVLPATGTPEPGGGDWFQALALLRLLFRHKQVVAMDIVELAPIPGQPASDFLAARLLYKCIAYRFRAELEAADPSQLARASSPTKGPAT